MAFQEYPKAMSHPQAAAAVLAKWDPKKEQKDQPMGKPAKFPPVHVNNKDQEQQYAALGYVPNGVADPKAYARAMAGANEPDNFKHHEYPKWLYRDVDGELESKIVNTAEEEKKLGTGWYRTPDEARNPPKPVQAKAEKTVDAKEQAEPRKKDKRKATRRTKTTPTAAPLPAHS